MDDGTKRGLNELVIDRTFAAPRALVFKAWTQPEHIARWWGCGHKQDIKVTNDLRVGGGFRAEMTLDDGSTHIISGTYLEIEEPSRLKFTWTWRNGDAKGSDTIVTIDFDDVGDATRMLFSHENFNTIEECDGHRDGWTTSFDRLSELAPEL